MKDSKTITFNGEEIEITKIPLRRFGELTMALDDLPELFKLVFEGEENLTVSNEKLIQKAPLLLTSLAEPFSKFLSAASGIDKEKILDAGLDDGLTLVETVLELNNLELIIAKIKNLGNLLRKK